MHIFEDVCAIIVAVLLVFGAIPLMAVGFWSTSPKNLDRVGVDEPWWVRTICKIARLK